MTIKRIRTIPTAVKEIRESDPNTSITEYFVRQLVIDGVIPSVKAGTKYLIDLDVLQDYLGGKA